MKLIISLIVVACFLSSLISCAPAVSPKIGFQSVAQSSKVIYTREKGEKYTLSKYLKVVKILSNTDENGLLNCAIVFNNNRYKKAPNLSADIQFTFFDENGFELEKTNWQPVFFSTWCGHYSQTSFQ